MDLPFAMKGYVLGFSHSFSAEAYLPERLAALHEALGRSKALLVQSEFAALFVISSVAWPESG